MPDTTLRATSEYDTPCSRGWAANSWNARIRLKAENDRVRQELAILREEMRIKDARMLRIPAQRRPHYPPIERLAILELRAARRWSLAQTARRLLVTTATVASWMSRLDEDGPNAIVRLPIPVNKFPDFVRHTVQRLETLCPTMGKAKIAQLLCRAGLHLGSTTVARMLHDPPKPTATPIASQPTARRVVARYPNHVWNLDLTTVPTSLGFWIPWLPFALHHSWPFCWWLAIAVDHHSRKMTGIRVFEREPTSKAVIAFFSSTFRKNGRPRHLITDQGPQFTAQDFVVWCRRRHVRQRFGAVGKHGSLAVIERAIRTLKAECIRRLPLVPFRLATFQYELSLYRAWFNAERPHTALGGCTPDELYFARRPANRMPRLEPRPRWPRRSPCAAPQVLVRGRPGVALELHVDFHRGRKHLPLVTLKRVA